MSRATQRLFRAQQRFLGTDERRCLTSSASPVRWRLASRPPRACCKALLARWPNTPKVDLVTTDGFLYPNAVLEREGLMERKGFPGELRSAGAAALSLRHQGRQRPVRAPVYSHLVYDVVPNQWIEIDRPDILIVEGLNVLQTGRLPKDGKAMPFVSDFFDFSIYIDADEEVLRAGMSSASLRCATPRSAIRNPISIAIRSCPTRKRSRPPVRSGAASTCVNLHENILPTRPRADLILKKGHHVGREVALRRL